MPDRLRSLAIRLAGSLPLSCLRVAVLRRLFGYSIGKQVKIGRRVVIDARSVRIGSGCVIAGGVRLRVADLTLGDECIISRDVQASGPFTLTLGARTSVGHSTEFVAGDWADPEQYPLECVIGPKVAISPQHFFDVVGGLRIDEGTWFAGRGSQVWTHGMGRGGRVHVGAYCYVGSAARIVPGVSLADRTLVAVGSVVTVDVDRPGCLVAGVPAEVKQTDYPAILEWRAAEAPAPSVESDGAAAQ